MQTSLVGLWVKNFTFSMLSSLKLNFSTTVFSITGLCTVVFMGDSGNDRKIVNLDIVALMLDLSKWLV